MKELLTLSIEEASNLIDSKSITPTELTNTYISAVSQSKDINAFVSTTFDLALDQSKACDDRANKKARKSKLDGIPLGYKDNFMVKGFTSTSCSKMLKDFVAPYTATTVSKLEDAGAVCLGKLNMDEFAMGSSNKTSYFGKCVNPWIGSDESGNFTPGGSSGGSAAAVAARLCMGSLGTDTGGSIRQPAAFTGTVGIKPTYGTCSRYGVTACASSLDCPGPIANSVNDVAIILDHMRGVDGYDNMMFKGSSDKKHYPLVSSNVKNMKVGYIESFLNDGSIDEDIRLSYQATIDSMKAEGATIVPLEFKYINYALSVYYIIMCVEVSSNLSRFDGIRYSFSEKEISKSINDIYVKSRTNGFGEEVKNRIAIGSYAVYKDHYNDIFLKAAKVRSVIAQEILSAFNNTIDVLCIPSTPTTAFKLDSVVEDPIVMYLNDVFTVPFSLVGLPGSSVPSGLDRNNMPIGMQIIGNHFREDQVLSVSKFIEDHNNLNLLSDFARKTLNIKGAY